MKYFILAFKNWNKFKGRSNRLEFWYFTLFYFIVGTILYFLDVSFLGFNPLDPTSTGVLQTIYGLVVLIDRIDFPSPNNTIEKKVPNENFKVIK